MTTVSTIIQFSLALILIIGGIAFSRIMVKDTFLRTQYSEFGLIGKFSETPCKSTLDSDWKGRDDKGNPLVYNDIEKAIEEHQLWLSSKHQQGKRLNFGLADLTNINLYGRDLSSGFLENAILRCAILSETKLNNASLMGADLGNARLNKAKLDSTELYGANLQGSDLRNTDLTNARLYTAILYGSIYEPKTPPEIGAAATAEGLPFLTFDENPNALVQLRKQFADSDFEYPRREITYAINNEISHLNFYTAVGITDKRIAKFFPASLQKEASNKMSSHGISEDSQPNWILSWFEFTFSFVMFDWTSRYGLEPGRTLRLAGALWFWLSVVYWISFQWGFKTAGVFRFVKLTDKITLKRHIRLRQSKRNRGVFFFTRNQIKLQLRLLRAAMYFSILCSTAIGYREFSLKQWMQMLTKREYEWKATGWLRTISGLQSILSLYLFAMWVITFFGHPFE